jgi:hypothetical protein
MPSPYDHFPSLRWPLVFDAQYRGTKPYPYYFQNYFQNRAILNIAPSSATRTISGERVKGARWKLWPLLHGVAIMRRIMLNHPAPDTKKSPEPPPPYRGAPPDSERTKKPPLPEPPYEPYKGM